MTETPKFRPIRIYGESPDLYYFEGGKKKNIKTKLRKTDAQKAFMSKLTGRLKFDKGRIGREYGVFTNTGTKLTPLDFSSSIKNVAEEDEGLKAIKRLDKNSGVSIEEIKKKLKEGKKLTDIELIYLPLLTSEFTTNEIKQELKQDLGTLEQEIKQIGKYPLDPNNELPIDDEKGREEKIRQTLIEFKINPDNVPIDKWNRARFLPKKFTIAMAWLKYFLENFYKLSPEDKKKVTFQFRTLQPDKGEDIEKFYIERLPPNLTPDMASYIISYGGISLFPNPRPPYLEWKQLGRGKLPALWNDEIEDYFSDENIYPDFGGVIASDQIQNLKKRLPIGFIMNLDKSDEPGSHWVACYINGDSVEYFDPLGQPPSNKFKKDIKDYLISMKIPILMKFKINNIAWQNEKTNHCGWFCIQWLDNRFNGVPFKEATKFTNRSNEGEKKLLKEFEYI